MKVEPAAHLDGHIGVPGDKSVSHRALLIGALCEGETRITRFGRSADTLSTLGVVRALGVEVADEDVDTLVVAGAGTHGLAEPAGPLDCGNAGTLARLASGVLAFQQGRFELVGDASLSSRPMGRVVEPLGRMGAALEATEGGLPLRIDGRPLHGIDYTLPVASAQVKSALLLAGLGARGSTTVHEPVATRDHTELMLAAAGAQLERRQATVTVRPGAALRLGEVTVPGDISSAAPFLVLAAMLPGSVLTVHDVGLNPLRTGILDVLARMGARVAVFSKHRSGGELLGDVEVAAAQLVATRIEAAEVPRLVDELPLVALLDRSPPARPRYAAPRSCAPRRATASRRSSRGCARSACASRPAPTASSCAGCAAAPAAGRSTRAATIASRCSRPSRARPRARACASSSPTAWR